MRTPKETCGLIDKIVLEIEVQDVEKTTVHLVLLQHAALLKEAAEGTEEGVKRLLLDLEIRNRLLDIIQLLAGSLSMAIKALPKDGQLRDKLIRVQGAADNV